MEKNQLWKDKKGFSWKITSIYDNMLGFKECIIEPYGFKGQKKSLTEKELISNYKFVGKI